MSEVCTKGCVHEMNVNLIMNSMQTWKCKYNNGTYNSKLKQFQILFLKTTN